MKKITSAVCGLAMTLAVAGASFAQTSAPAATTPAPAAKENGSAMTSKTTKKHVKKAHVKKDAQTTAAPASK